MKVKARKWLIRIIVFATVIYYGMSIFKLFIEPDIFLVMRMDFMVKDNYLVVRSIREEGGESHNGLAEQSGIKIGDRIVAIYYAHGERKSVDSHDDFNAMIRKIKFGEPWTLEVEREIPGEGWKQMQLHVPPAQKSSIGIRSWILYIGFGVVLPLISIITAFFMGLMKPEDNNAFRAFLLFLGFATIFGRSYLMFPQGFLQFGMLYRVLLNCMVVYLFARFFLTFPSPSSIDRMFPWIKKIFLTITILYFAYNMLTLYSLYYSYELHKRVIDAFPSVGKIFDYMLSIMFITGLVSLILNTIRPGTRDERRRMMILLAGTVIGLVPLFVYLIFMNSIKEPSLFYLLFIGITVCLFPLSFAYVVVKHRVFGIKLIVRRGLQYMLISRGFLVAEGVFIFLILFVVAGPVLMKLIPGLNANLFAMGSAFIAMGAIGGIRIVNKRVMPVIDRRFFRDAYNAQRVLADLAHSVRLLATQPDALVKTAIEKISDCLYPAHAAIFLRTNHEAALTMTREAELQSLPETMQERYLCISLKARTELIDNALKNIDCSTLDFPVDGFVARYLDIIEAEEPQALEVYLDDPQSWTNILAPFDTAKNELFREKKIIQLLGTRLLVPLMTKDRMLGFMSLGEKLSEEPYSKEDKELLLATAEQVAIALDYSQLIREVAEQEKLKQEVEIAKEVQTRLFPQAMPPMKSLDYSGICKAARKVSGDYYDFLPLAHDRLGIAVGDISGKGISAALLMASLQALLRSNAPLSGSDVSKLAKEINNHICASTDANKFATFFYAYYDDTERSLTYVNAGHNPPFLFKQKDKEHYDIIRLSTGGMVLGVIPETVYEQECVLLEKGDLFLIFTDGITEAMNLQEEEYGEDHLADLIISHAHLSAEQLRDLILSEIEKFTGSVPQHDDQTLIIAKIK